MVEIKKSKKIVIFTTSSCKWCKVAKDYFKQKGYKFKAIDISKDKQAANDCIKHGCRGVPVILIGSRWICGFDQKSIEKALK
jgi:glutaredoxin-like YruB-family protein